MLPPSRDDDLIDGHEPLLTQNGHADVARACLVLRHHEGLVLLEDRDPDAAKRIGGEPRELRPRIDEDPAKTHPFHPLNGADVDIHREGPHGRQHFVMGDRDARPRRAGALAPRICERLGRVLRPQARGTAQEIGSRRIRVRVSSTDTIAPCATVPSMSGSTARRTAWTRSTRDENSRREITDGVEAPASATMAEKSKSWVRMHR